MCDQPFDIFDLLSEDQENPQSKGPDMNRFPMYTRLFVIAWIFLGLSAVGFAEEDLSSGGERVLQGHGFLPSEYIVGPFVGTIVDANSSINTAFNKKAKTC